MIKLHCNKKCIGPIHNLKIPLVIIYISYFDEDTTNNTWIMQLF
jgi:hypothetical protein